jgi:hypothetical protein
MAAAHVVWVLDLENLAEEIESFGRSDWRAARSQVQRVIEHLLKLEFSPAREPRPERLDWIDQARDELADLLTPVLRREVGADLVSMFDRELAAAGALLPATRAQGLSLGDRACLALAHALGAAALTTNRAWRGLEVGVIR